MSLNVETLYPVVPALSIPAWKDIFHVSMIEPTLCYVWGNWAWFKFQCSEEVDEAFDCQYTDLCGMCPYSNCVKFMFCADMERPDDAYREGRCPHTMRDIENGEVPWLRDGELGIMHGCPVTEFVQIVEQNGGAVSVPGRVLQDFSWEACKVWMEKELDGD